MALKWEVKFRYGEPQIFDDSNSAACAITENEEYIGDLDVDVDESLDECYGRIQICGTDYWASQILKELNETQYYEYLDDERRSRAENDRDWVEEQLDKMDDGDEERFEGGIRVTCFEDDEDEDDEDSHAEGFLEIFDYAT